MEKEKTKEKKNKIQSLARAFMILDLLKESKTVSLGKIAKKLSLAKTTVHGLLSTLVDFGYVEKSSLSGEYKLGYKLFELGTVVSKQWEILNVASPFLEKLVNEINETAHLAVLSEGEVLYIDKQESHRSLKIVSEVGSKLPAHCTALGKMLLSNLNGEELSHIISSKGLSSFTRNTITDLLKLENELEEIRKRGYAVDNEEIMDGLKCIAAPIYNHEERMIASLSISGPVFRLLNNQFYNALNLVTSTALEISLSLGFRIKEREMNGNT